MTFSAEKGFFVLDTEGNPTLKEIAVFDSHGKSIFEAHVSDSEASYYTTDLVRPLSEVLNELRSLVKDHRLVAHNASHDAEVIRNSFQKCGLKVPEFEWECTYKLAKKLHPNLETYSLGPLCDQLEVSSEPFRQDNAHAAVYDAQFTYFLYRHLQRVQHSQRLSNEQNPLSSSRVDTPFQSFVDEMKVNETAFRRLSAVLKSVASDRNRQSKGAVLLGDPGSGKTHMLMRLANETLETNRLLFIRQPTQASSVLFHIYSRTLESLVEQVGHSHTQLDLLLIRSIRTIFRNDSSEVASDLKILEALEAEDLTLLGKEGTSVRRSIWERIEARVLRWWADNQSGSGSGRQILQGLLRYCRYKRQDLKESCRRWLATGEHEPIEKELEGLSPWNDHQMREEFSLQALRVIGHLSCLDKPLIMVFDQLEGLWIEGNRNILLRFGEVIKELFTHVPYALILVTLFPNRWSQFKNDFDESITDRIAQDVIALDQPRADQLEEILNLRLKPLGATIRELLSDDELRTIINQNSIRSSINNASVFFEYHVNGVPLPKVIKKLDVKGNSGEKKLINHRIFKLEKELFEIKNRLESLESRANGKAVEIADANLVGKIAGRFVNRQIKEEEPITLDKNHSESINSLDVDEYENAYGYYRENLLQVLNKKWSEIHIVDESDDAGKLYQVCIHYQNICPIEITSLRLGRKRVPDNVLISLGSQRYCIGFLHVNNGVSTLARLRNFSSLVLSHPDVKFILFRDQFSEPIRSEAAKNALKAYKNGSGVGPNRTFYRKLDNKKRIELEYSFRLVGDIDEKEVDWSLAEGFQLLEKYDPENWLVRLFMSNPIL